jgi:hypothetical protein
VRIDGHTGPMHECPVCGAEERTAPPCAGWRPPIGATLTRMTRWATGARRLRVDLRFAVAIVLAIIVTNCGTADSGVSGDRRQDLASPSVEPSDNPWDEIGIAYQVAHQPDSPRITVGYRGSQVELDTSADDDGNPDMRVLSMTSTSDAGAFLLGSVGGANELFLLTASGEWTQIAKNVAAIPMSDLVSPWLFWRSDDNQLHGYNTTEDKQFGPVAAPGELGYITVTEDDTAYLSDGFGRAFRWTAGQPEPEPIKLDNEREIIDSTRHGVFAFAEDDGGYRVADQRGPLWTAPNTNYDWGRLSPDARYLAFDTDPFALLSLIDDPREVTLPLPSKWHVASAEWTPAGALVVSGTDFDTTESGVRSFVCDVDAQACEEFPQRSLGVAVTNSSRGTFILTEPEDFE